MPGDPQEHDWLQFYTAAIKSGDDVHNARLKADKALAVYVERWPRHRQVVPREEHERLVKDERARAIAGMCDTIITCAHSAATNIERDRRDAAHVLHSFAESVRQHTWANGVEASSHFGPMIWQAPCFEEDQAVAHRRARLAAALGVDDDRTLKDFAESAARQAHAADGFKDLWAPVLDALGLDRASPRTVVERVKELVRKEKENDGGKQEAKEGG